MTKKDWTDVFQKVTSLVPLTPDEGVVWQLLCVMEKLGTLKSKALSVANGVAFEHWPAWSTEETLAVAIIHNRHDVITRLNYTMLEALERVGPIWKRSLQDIAAELRASWGPK